MISLLQCHFQRPATRSPSKWEQSHPPRSNQTTDRASLKEGRCHLSPRQSSALNSCQVPSHTPPLKHTHTHTYRSISRQDRVSEGVNMLSHTPGSGVVAGSVPLYPLTQKSPLWLLACQRDRNTLGPAKIWYEDKLAVIGLHAVIEKVLKKISSLIILDFLKLYYYIWFFILFFHQWLLFLFMFSWFLVFFLRCMRTFPVRTVR